MKLMKVTKWNIENIVEKLAMKSQSCIAETGSAIFRECKLREFKLRES